MCPESSCRRVLFVSYLFPPVGGVGVLRVTRFVRYLPDFGWRSSVLTVANPSVPVFDESLLRHVPDGTIVGRARTLEPGYGLKSSVADHGTKRSVLARAKWRFRKAAKRAAGALLQPDAQILWYRAAVREGLRILRSETHDAIIASGPPFTNLLVGAALARGTGLPLVLDYRDEWDISNAYWENRRPGRLSAMIQRRMQRHAVRSAAAIVATTPSSARALRELAVQWGSRAESTCIYNGFDAADFSGADEPLMRRDYGNGTELFRLTFAGTLWELTSIEPFVAGVERLAALAPSLAPRLEIVLAGRRAGRQDAFIDRLETLPCRVVRLGFLEHREAIHLMSTSDSLLLLLSDLPHADRVISSKVFEYMGARRPIFAVSPPGDQTDVLREHPAATIVLPQSPDQIAAALAARLEEHRCGIVPTTGEWDCSRFDRRSQAGQLASLLDTLVDVRARRSRGIGGSETADINSPTSSDPLPAASFASVLL